MTKYDVWMEGYLATGMEGMPCPATFVGTCEADSFKEACIKLCGNDSNFNEDHLSVWGCRLYDNETSARRLFG